MQATQIGGQTAVRVVDPVTSPKWADLVSTTDSTIFHSPQWMSVIRATYGGALSACVLERDGQTVAGVPWYQARDFMATRRITLAFSDYCDILAASPADAARVAQVVGGAGESWLLRTRARAVPRDVFPVAHCTTFRWQAINLAADCDTLWNRVSSMMRRGVRKAEQSGVAIRLAKDKDELRAWYSLHLRIRKGKHHLLAQPYGFFENIWDTFIANGQGYLMLATLNEQVIGGVLYLSWKDTCYYKFSASDTASLAVRPNNLVMWRGILEAKARGFRWLDLGRSNARQEGLIAFKRGFGAIEEDMLALTYQTGGPESPQEREGRRLLQELTGLFVQDSVPDSVSAEAGDLLYRFFT